MHRWHSLIYYLSMRIVLYRLRVLTHRGGDSRHFADDTDMFQMFQIYFRKETCCILIAISLTLVPTITIDNELPFVKIMAWCWTGEKIIISANDGLLHRCIYALHAFSELRVYPTTLLWFCCAFTPQPFRLEEYCRTTSGMWAYLPALRQIQTL